MRPTVRIGLMAGVMILVLAATAATQEEDTRLLSMEYGTLFGYDISTNGVVTGQEFAFLLRLSDEVEAGASFIQGTGVMNAQFFRLDYAFGPAAVQMSAGLYNTTVGGGTLGVSLGAEFVPLSRSFQGVTTELSTSVEYLASTGLGIDNGTAAVTIAASLGI
jgi:hypothetical protein